MIIAIDFDGTIVRGKYPNIDGLMPNAKQCIDQMAAQDHYIIIHTCRSGEHLLNAINYLIEQGIRFNRVNDNHPDQIRMYNNNSRKVYAHVYVDDKNVFGFPGWRETIAEIERLDKEWKTKSKTESNG